MNAFLNNFMAFLHLFHDEPLFMFSFCGFLFLMWAVWFYITHRHSPTTLLHEQAKLLHANLKDSAVLAEEFLELKEKAHKAQKDIESLQKDNTDLIKSLEILNQRFIESEAMRQILIEENHELRYLFQFAYNELLVSDQKLSLNKYIKFDYKKYLD